MSVMFKLKPLGDYIKKFVDKGRTSKGVLIFSQGKVSPLTPDQDFAGGDDAVFKVSSETGSARYTVIISNYLSDSEIEFQCTCPDAQICKHSVAAALKLDQLLGISSANQLEIENIEGQTLNPPPAAKPEKKAKYNMAEIAITEAFSLLNDKAMKTLVSKEDLALGRKIQKSTTLRSKALFAEAIIFEVPILPNTWYNENPTVKVFFALEADLLHSSCECGHIKLNPLCEHKVAVLVELINKGFSWRNAPSAKTKINELLLPYGINYDSPERKKFFNIDYVYGQVVLTPLNKSLKPLPATKVNALATLPKFVTGIIVQNQAPTEKRTFHWVLAISDGYYKSQIYPFIGIYNLKSGNITKVSPINDLGPGNYVHLMSETDVQLSRIVATALDSAKSTDDDRFQEVLAIASKSIEAFDLITQLPTFFVGEIGRNAGITKVKPMPVGHKVSTAIELSETADCYVLQVKFKLDNAWVNPDNFEWFGDAIFTHNGTLYCLSDAETVARLDHFFPNKELGLSVFKFLGFEDFYNSYAAPLSAWWPLENKIKSIETEIRLMEPDSALLYLEDDANEKLHFTPVFKYKFGETEAEFTQQSAGNFSYAEGNKLIENLRNREWESEKLQLMEGLHPSFAGQTYSGKFELGFDKAMQDNWIGGLFEAAKDAGIILLGDKQFKNFKYSTLAPSYKLRISSGIDWFDVKPSLAFGDEKIPMKKLRQAVLEGKHYVVLSDGTYGILPTEWLRRLAPVFRLGAEDKNGVRMRKTHGHLLGELAEEAGDLQLAEEISAKYARLLTADTIKPAPLPKSLSATLRSYQYKGFCWLRYHENLGFGALLADDMGLGKTLQVLSQLTAVCEENVKARHLIVMPTALLYNWRNEAAKFSSSLKVASYYGSNRAANTDWKEANLVLTTYGTLRSDIDLLSKEEWDYVVLDESQAIKNPVTAAAKSVKQLKARNRIAMTGTPVENHTMDLFSQLEFLNPGLLGSAESFFNNYARPIDRDGNEQMAQELRKLVAPYILRRTKQQVATDLPDKTETTLYCALSPTQAKVYEQVKEEYKEKILEKISQGGRNMAGTLILAGLTKLRQVCDSAAIIRPELGLNPGHSSKLDLLEEELISVTESNKVLVFSNFLGMLGLVKQRLEQRGIGYSYMDGSSRDREAIVEEFKNDENKKVFLITLKTGGVGLNLTEAGYVYIIDPWWNPAAEAQAIDRTHRIGQTNPVFAYKMITTGTVEEKILSLQARKQKLAGDLISTEEGLLSQLSDSEVLDLFD